MPKKEAESVRKSKRHTNLEKPTVKVDHEFSDSNASSEEILDNSKTPLHAKYAAKRSAVNMEDGEKGLQMDCSGEMSHILENFGSDMSKMLAAKRKRLERCTQETVRVTKTKILEATKAQFSERNKLVEEFRKQMTSLIEQAETDMERAKEIDEKFQKLIVQHQRHQHQLIRASNNRLKALKALGDQFFKGMEDLENYHQQQYLSVSNDLVKEMTALQKKIVMTAQQQDMINVRKNLHSMLM